MMYRRRQCLSAALSQGIERPEVMPHEGYWPSSLHVALPDMKADS